MKKWGFKWWREEESKEERVIIMRNRGVVRYSRIRGWRNGRNDKMDRISIDCVVGEGSVEGVGGRFGN